MSKEMKMKLTWRQTSVGGYVANGGALLRSWSAYITPSDDRRWYAAIEIDGNHEYSEHASAAAAKRWAAGKVKK
jgi:hypothetical protein